jgi:hypothetical protein
MSRQAVAARWWLEKCRQTVSRRAAPHWRRKIRDQRARRRELCRRFGFGAQNDTGLAAPGERGERTVVPVAHRGGVVLVEASELERFTI